MSSMTTATEECSAEARVSSARRRAWEGGAGGGPRGGGGQLRAGGVVEGAVVEEAGAGVRPRLVLEPSPAVRVVERERGCIAEPLGALELLGRGERVLA